MNIRQATLSDWPAIWPIFSEIVAAGDTYAYRRDTTEKEAMEIWLNRPRVTFVAIEEDAVLGTYYLKTKQEGPGNHVCNCGYMVSSAARGRGLASAMCEHSQKVALELGYRAMQFNFVSSINAGALRLWQKLGFEVVGTLPGAFAHPEDGDVDAQVMYKRFAQEK